MTVDRPRRLRWVAASLLAIACGCNQVLGVTGTELVDARYFDVGIDAPFACPPAGETPAFDRNLVQAVFQQVYDYTISTATGRAMGQGAGGVTEGPIDELMTVQMGLERTSCLSCNTIGQPRLTPEGDGMYGMQTSMTGSRIVLYQQFAGVWNLVTDFGPTSLFWISTVTRGPTRRAMGVDGTDLRELELTDAGKLTEIAVYQPLELGVKYARSPMLTPDGLRMVFVGTDIDDTESMYYTDRPDLAARFATSRPLLGVPVVDGAYLTENCSRIYLSGLGSVFYAPRI